MRAVTGGRLRAADVYILAAMLLAATGGRVLDALGLLPGVHEAGAVRGAGAAWLTALVAAAALAAVAARRWAATSSLAATVAVAMTGQLGVFFGAEAVVRVASGNRPLDPDGVVGALLQAGLAAVLLLALTVATGVALRDHVVPPRVPALPRLSTASTADTAGCRLTGVVGARGPPTAVARC